MLEARTNDMEAGDLGKDENKLSTTLTDRSAPSPSQAAVEKGKAKVGHEHVHSPPLDNHHFNPSHHTTAEEHAAAIAIQKTYRGYRTRRQLRGHRLTAEQRWDDAISEIMYRTRNKPLSRAEREKLVDGHIGIIPPTPIVGGGECVAEKGGTGLKSEDNNRKRSLSPASKDRWNRVAYIAKMVQQDDPESDNDSSSSSGISVDGTEDLGGDLSSHDVSSSGSGGRHSKSNNGADDAASAERDRRKEEIRKKKLERVKDAKAMDMQYFLELVDLKHRYGANLKVYHDHWQKEDTHENFFYWLDSGAGRCLELAPCPRQQLDSEKVRYLSREERQAYLVKIDDEGKLCWARNGDRIDTSEKWTNSKHGIVPLSSEEMKNRLGGRVVCGPKVHNVKGRDDDEGGQERKQHNLWPHLPHWPQSLSNQRKAAGAAALPLSPTTLTSSPPSLSNSSGSSDSEQAQRYTQRPASMSKKVYHFSPIHILNRLLRTTTKKNTWIFVADTSFRLYIGIKQSGAFQHSSFLHGARVSAAGLIKIRDGKLTSLSPLSGHYRPPASNFRKFLHSLEDAGVDMSKVRISKSYAVLVGLEAYTKFVGERKKLKHLKHLKGHGRFQSRKGREGLLEKKDAEESEGNEHIHVKEKLEKWGREGKERIGRTFKIRRGTESASDNVSPSGSALGTDSEKTEGCRGKGEGEEGKNKGIEKQNKKEVPMRAENKEEIGAQNTVASKVLQGITEAAASPEELASQDQSRRQSQAQTQDHGHKQHTHAGSLVNE